MKKGLLLFLLVAFFAIESSAKHIIGGVLTYECLGNGLYHFTLKMYRDCSDPTAGNFDQFAPISFYKGNSPFPEETIHIGPDIVTDLEPDIDNPCLILPPNICVEEAIYTFDWVFGDWPSTEPYTVSYQRCCRNVTITNVVDPGSIGATFSVEITPESQEECNNSPVFENFPPIVICQGEPIDFLHNATDVEGDQLIYELCAPLEGGGLAGTGGVPGGPNGCNGVTPDPACPPPYDPVDYVPPYTPLNPLGGNPQVTIDPITGMITGVPDILGQFVVGVCVKEYRNGELLSVIQRDFQFNVASCEPVVFADIQEDSLLGEQYYLLEACAEDNPLTIINESTLNPFLDNYNWNFTLADTLFESTELEPTITFPGPGLYEGQFLINPGFLCADTARVLVEIYPEVLADFSYTYDTCEAGPVFFVDESTADPTPLESWLWNFGDNEVYEGRNPTHVYEEPGNFLASLLVEDIHGCEDGISVNVTYFPVPNLIIVSPDAEADCPPSEINFLNLSSPVDETYEIFWEFGDGGIDSVLSPSHTYTEPGTYSVAVNIVSPIGCETDTLFEDLIFIDELPVADFRYSPDYFSNLQPDITLVESAERAVHWDWYINGERKSTDPIWSYSFPDTGQQEVMLIVTHRFGCVDTLIQYVDVAPEIRYYLPNAFTPNDDNLNDLFLGTGILRGIQEFELQIWDRWGGLIFETDDPLEAWNGRQFNTGRLVQDGVYVCTVRFREPRGAPFEYKGFVTVLR
ncbi:MAG: PKD domain-containing protein [Phaeodactylibacter sp.]|nr:PKD domain-containing protein [Phaeodactylibacter sp.]